MNEWLNANERASVWINLVQRVRDLVIAVSLREAPRSYERASRLSVAGLAILFTSAQPYVSVQPLFPTKPSIF